MTRYFVQDTSLTAIADAIRAKTGGTDALTLDGMAEAVAGIEAGGGDVEMGTFMATTTGACRITLGRNEMPRFALVFLLPYPKNYDVTLGTDIYSYALQYAARNTDTVAAYATVAYARRTGQSSMDAGANYSRSGVFNGGDASSSSYKQLTVNNGYLSVYIAEAGGQGMRANVLYTYVCIY